MLKQLLLSEFELCLIPQKSGSTHKGNYRYRCQSFSKMSAKCLTVFNKQNIKNGWDRNWKQNWKETLCHCLNP